MQTWVGWKMPGGDSDDDRSRLSRPSPTMLVVRKWLGH